MSLATAGEWNVRITETSSGRAAAAVRAEESYLAAFFGRFLRDQDNHLLDGPSPRYPEFTFIR